MISISKLSYSFGRQLALKDINFCMKQGEFVFLCGPSGAGKTTFMRILHGALPVQRGKADVAGYDLNTLPESRKHLLRRDVSVVFQDFKILTNQTVFANVALPLKVRGIGQHIIEKECAPFCAACIWITRPAHRARSFPAANSSAWPWPGPWWSNQSSCWPMSPRATLTMNCPCA